MQPLKDSTNIMQPLKDLTNIMQPLKDSTNTMQPVKDSTHLPPSPNKKHTFKLNKRSRKQEFSSPTSFSKSPQITSSTPINFKRPLKLCDFKENQFTPIKPKHMKIDTNCNKNYLTPITQNHTKTNAESLLTTDPLCETTKLLVEIFGLTNEIKDYDMYRKRFKANLYFKTEFLQIKTVIEVKLSIKSGELKLELMNLEKENLLKSETLSVQPTENSELSYKLTLRKLKCMQALRNEFDI